VAHEAEYIIYIKYIYINMCICKRDEREKEKKREDIVFFEIRVSTKTPLPRRLESRDC